VFIKTIKYYENTNCTLKKGKKKSAQLLCVEVLHVNVGFFYAQLKYIANGISVQNVNVLPNIYGHIFEISLTYSMKFVKIYSITKISSQISVIFYI
jgi:hypothetical protein